MWTDWLAAHLHPVFNSILYSALGLGIMLVSLKVVEMLAPFSVRKEIEQDHNTALGIILGAFIVAVAIIVSAAIR